MNTQVFMKHPIGVDRADKERAYLLHQRPYRETSMICYFFTRHYGIVHILIKGARRPRGSYTLLQPTLELSLSWSGKSSLKTLRGIEQRKRHLIYSGKQLILLLYVSELLLKLLKPHDAHTQLYDDYDAFLSAQASSPHKQNIRRFEHQMFKALGYALSYDKDYKSGQAIVAKEHYCYKHKYGFTQTAITRNSFPGYILLALNANAFHQPQVLQAAQRLSRIVLHYLMEDRPLISRQLLSYKK